MEIARTHDTLRVRDSDLNRSTYDDANLSGMTIDGVLVLELLRVYRSRATR
jgi:hypothetical protein